MTPQQLKTSVLQYAVEGKLVKQKAGDGNAETLYQQIKMQKQELIKEGRLKKEKLQAPVGKEEIPFDIPENWKWIRLGDIVSVFGGKRIPAGRKLTTENTGYKYIRVSDMKEGSVLTENLLYVPVDIYPSISRYVINKEDVYITVAGTIGRVGKIPPELDGVNLTENADRLVFHTINQDWLIRTLESDLIQQQIIDATTKVGQPKLAIKRIQELLIPLPPIEEQNRIVKKIEEILPIFERYAIAYDKLEKFNDKFPEDMKKSILQYAIQGKLVEQRTEEGTGQELFEKIQEEKEKIIKEGKIKRGKELAEIEYTDTPFDIPNSWKWVHLFDLSEEKPTNGYSVKGVDYQTPVRNLTLTATTSGYFKADAFKYVDIQLEPDSKYWLKKNDILIQRSNSRELVGTSCIYTGDDNAFIYPDLMMKIKLLPSVDVKYVDYVLKSPITRNYFSKSASGTSESMPKINQGIVMHTLIPLPPLAEQKRIVAMIEELLPYCDRLVKEMDESK